MTRKEANEKLSEFVKTLAYQVTLEDVDKIMDFIEDYDIGLGMQPAPNKKGRFLWDDTIEQDGTK